MKIVFIILICIFGISSLVNLYRYGIALKAEQASEKSNRFLERKVNRSLLLVTTNVAFIALILAIWVMLYH